MYGSRGWESSAIPDRRHGSRQAREPEWESQSVCLGPQAGSRESKPEVGNALNLRACPQCFNPSPPQTPRTSPSTGDQVINYLKLGGSGEVIAHSNPTYLLQKWRLGVHHADVSVWDCQGGNPQSAHWVENLSPMLWIAVVWLFIEVQVLHGLARCVAKFCS